MKLQTCTLDLYCDRKNHGRNHDELATFTARDHATCRAQAKRAGWKLRNDGTTLCPKCTRRHGPIAPASKDTNVLHAFIQPPEQECVKFFAAASGEPGNYSAGLLYALDTLYHAVSEEWPATRLQELLDYLRRVTTTPTPEPQTTEQ